MAIAALPLDRSCSASSSSPCSSAASHVVAAPSAGSKRLLQEIPNATKEDFISERYMQQVQTDQDTDDEDRLLQEIPNATKEDFIPNGERGMPNSWRKQTRRGTRIAIRLQLRIRMQRYKKQEHGMIGNMTINPQ